MSQYGQTAHTHCCSTPTRNSIWRSTKTSHCCWTSQSCCSTDPRPEPRMTNARSCWIDPRPEPRMTSARCCSTSRCCWIDPRPEPRMTNEPSCCLHRRSPRRRSTRNLPRAARNCSRRHHRRQAQASMQEQTQDAQILACTRMTAEMRLPHDQMVLFYR